MTSVLSLLMTDIVGSTRRWARYEQEMNVDLAVHDAVLVRVVDAFGGSVFKHTGDGGMATFDDPHAAVCAAAEFQAAVASTAWTVPEGLQVRVAVNTGVVVQRDGDVFGSAVNRAARLLGLCPPGAVLVGQSTAVLVGDRSLGPLGLRPVGQVVLRGFAHPEAVFALHGPGVVAVDQTVGEVGMDARARSVPVIDEGLVGRADELKTVAEAVLGHPVVTIVGVGGMGKTRLAVEIAAGLMDDFSDGVWWCDLATANSAEAVAPVVLTALGAREMGGQTAVGGITTRLAGRRALVVLDNCEHVLTATAELVRVIRGACETVRVLATSREAIGVRGEHVVALSSLPVDQAVELFVQRALAVRVDLDLSGDALDVVRDLCVQLDGIPLAVELAAARCRSMTPAEVKQRLRDRFRLLRSGRAASERHRTLQAAIAWSYDLLDADEQHLFDHLAVFADGALIDGVAAVAGLAEYDALDLLDRLVARSLVIPVTTPLGTRYRQLETLRQYAEDRLIERDALGAARDRHLEWVGTLAQWMHDRLGTAAAADAFRRYLAELDNLRVAVSHAADSGAIDTAKDILAEVAYYVSARATFEVLDWLDPHAGTPPWTSAAVDVIGLFGYLGFVHGDLGAAGRAVTAVPAEHRHSYWLTFSAWAEAGVLRGDPDLADAVVDAYRPGDWHERHTCDVMRMLNVTVRAVQGRLAPGGLEDADARCHELIADARRHGDALGLAGALGTYAALLVSSDRPDLALAPATEAIEITDALSATYVGDFARANLARALAAGARHGTIDPTRAAAQLRLYLTQARRREDHMSSAMMIDGVAVLVADRAPDTACVLAAFFTALWSMPTFLDPHVWDSIGPEAAAVAQARAAKLSIQDAVRLALDTLDDLDQPP